MTKSFKISKKEIYECYKAVKSNKGSAGIDGKSMEDFEKDLKNNLYRIWNRLSSGSYLPPAVKLVAIPKADGGERVLGIPTISDRIAQMVVKRALESIVEPKFHKDSYGYRPNKSAKDALKITRTRCWSYDWVVDLDISGFFDAIDHELMMKAVRHVTDSKFILLYVERWLKADAINKEGKTISRKSGTPQGGVVSPILANLFLHYALDCWLQKNFTSNSFARYADDMVIHCSSESEAKHLLLQIKERLSQCKLKLHCEKTKIAYCKDSSRKLNYSNIKFTFLGYTFQPREVKTKYGYYRTSFSPAMSLSARKLIGNKIREWRIHKRTSQTIEEIAQYTNPVTMGWMNYYCMFHKNAFSLVTHQLDRILMSWSQKKYKKIGSSGKRAVKWLVQLKSEHPNLFVHWQLKAY